MSFPGGDGDDVEQAGALAAVANLAVEPETEFYLGLVHAEDDAAGARYRAALASNFLAEFGLSTEYGLGRHSAEQLDRVAATVAELFGTKTPALA
jgi:hypothetical protein